MWFNSTVPGAPYQPPWQPRSTLMRGRGRAAQWRCMAVVSSCCEAWPWVAQRTQPAGDPRPTPAERPGWGAGSLRPTGRSPKAGAAWAAAEVKSIWPRSAGPHTCHKGRCNGPRWRQPQRTPNRGPSSDCALQVARTKLKPLVIVHQQVTVKRDQALHTPPITLGKHVSWEGVRWPWGGPQPGSRPGRSERS